MLTPWRSLLTALTVVGAVCVGGRALACDCSPSNFDDELSESEAVFIGRAAAIDGERVSFEVRTRWKGRGSVVFLQQGQGIDCRHDFELGRDYLVFARRHGQGLFGRAHHCGLTQPAEDACEVLSQLGRPSRDSGTAALIAAATALLSLGLAGFRRTRRLAIATAAVGGIIALAVLAKVHTGPPDYQAQSPSSEPTASGVPVGTELRTIERRGQIGGPFVFAPAADEILGVEFMDDLICRYGVASGKPPMCADHVQASGIAVDRAGTQMAVATNGGMELRALPSFALLKTLNSRAVQYAEHIQFDFNGQKVAVGHWGQVSIVDLAAGEIVRTVGHPELGGDSLAISGDGRRAAVEWPEEGPDGRWRVAMHVFSLDDGRKLASVSRACGGGSRNVSLDEKGRTLAWAEPGGVQIFDVETQKVLTQFDPGVRNGVPLLSPDGTRVAIAGDTVGIWETKSGRQLLQFSVHSAAGWMAFSPDGRRLAVGAFETIKILNVEPR